jgi:hypothetical protein
MQIHARTRSGTSMAEGKPLDLSHRTPRVDYEQNALKQGHTAVNSMLRDWVKAQVSIIECGILSFEAVFMPYMLTNDGHSLIERFGETDLLPKPDEKIVSLPKALNPN